VLQSSHNIAIYVLSTLSSLESVFHAIFSSMYFKIILSFLRFAKFGSKDTIAAALNLGKKLKVKQSHYRPGQVLRVPGGSGSQISRQLAHKSGKVVSPTHRPPLLPGNIPGTHFC